MKVAVSIPNRIFEAADDLAESLAVSRSELYAKALDAYLQTRGADAVRERLDAVYAVQNAAVDSSLIRAQVEILADEAW